MCKPLNQILPKYFRAIIYFWKLIISYSVLGPSGLWVQAPGLESFRPSSVTSCLTSVTSGNKINNLSLPWFSHLGMKILSSIYILYRVVLILKQTCWCGMSDTGVVLGCHTGGPKGTRPPGILARGCWSPLTSTLDLAGHLALANGILASGMEAEP